MNMTIHDVDQKYLQTLTVLYVEDEDTMFEQGVRLITRMCGTLLTARNGVEGLEMFRLHGPDIILTDINMPVLDGLTMAETIRLEDRAVSIIILTGFEQTEYLKRAIEIGINEYILKPAHHRQIMEKLCSCAHHLRVESELRQNNEQLRKLSRVVEQSPAAIVITDVTGAIEFVNQSFIEFTGYDREELIGQNPRLLKSQNTPEHLYRELWATITGGRPWTGELQNLRKDGSFTWESAIISPLFDDNGVITHFIGIKENITEKKLLVEQLIYSQKVESVGQLACGLAHDLNNILTVINGFGTLLQIGGDVSPVQRKQIKEIMAASSQASALTHSMLAYGRKQIIKQVVQSLGPVMNRVSEFVRRLIREDIELVITPPELPLLVSIDAGQIEQVLINLTTNARDAMPAGGKLTISARQGIMTRSDLKGCGNPCAILSVADTGHGMDGETRQRIFDPFFTTKEIGKGSGLGLAMVYGIITQHGGYVEVLSEPAKGSVFNLHLPLVVTAESGGLSADSAEDEYRLAEGAETILVAEDDLVTRMLLAEVLTTAGYHVIPAIDGRDACEKFLADRERIKLIISDVVMPTMGGKAMYDTIRIHSKSVPFLFMSGYGADVIQQGGGLDVDCAFLDKPLIPLQLLQKVRRLITAS